MAQRQPLVAAVFRKDEMMESAFRSALIAWLRADATLAARLNAILEEGPAPAPPPQLAIVASAAADWGSKDVSGRQVRVALELLVRGDDPDTATALAAAIETRIAVMAPQQDGFRIVVTRFLRSRVERRPREVRAILFEYQFSLLETPPATAAAPAPGEPT